MPATHASNDRTRIEANAPVPTWFGVGGRADALARPATAEDAAALIRAHDRVHPLGDGANLLVDDEGVDGLVLSLEKLDAVRWPNDGEDPVVRVGAGANLPRLIVESVRRGLEGIETLAGVPASIGGAARMNAGGAFGEFASAVESIDAIDAQGHARTLSRDQCAFAYRASALDGLIVTAATLRLRWADDRAALRERLKEVMAYKKRTQPMADRSAGCCFKNPTIDGQRVSAGKLIDDAGCKGLACGGATISHAHANFIVVREGASARDVMRAMHEAQRRVLDRFGVRLEPEIAIWARPATQLPNGGASP